MNMGKRAIAHSILVLYCISWIGALNGCALFELEDELEGLAATYRLTGKLQGTWNKDNPLVAVLYQQEDEGFRITDYVVPDPEGHYSFLVPEGVYLLAVFEDANQNFRYDSDEHFGFANQSKPLVTHAERKTSGSAQSIPNLNIELAEKEGFPGDLPTFVDISRLSGKSYIKIGVVTDLDDPLFVQENGSMGYWKPLSFLRDVGAGIYFLEKYTPKKIPVLFVHGANGTPAGWQPLVDQLDRKKYQPCFFYYPSGIRIESIASALNAMIHSLDENHRLTKMVVVAHSMGGLVSRAFILKNAVEDQQPYIYKFISISTPWGGVSTAEIGVEKSPIVAPNWIDVAPKSEFIASLYTTPLPE